MGDSLKDQLYLLVKRFGNLLNDKISEKMMFLINHKNTGSFGALAGLAIAVVFTWKFLRSPNRPRRRQQKRRGSPSGGEDSLANEVDPNSEVHQLVSDSKDQHAIEEFHPSIKLTLGQVVRKKLSGGRKMTCQLLGVILEETSPEELQKHATVRLPVLEVLLEITKCCDFYLMERILDDESGEKALSALEDAGIFRAGSLIKDKVLFCSTENGRLSFARQLEPDWHVDTNVEIISQLARFIRYELHISPTGSSHTAPNVFRSRSFEQFFSSPHQS